MKLVGLTGGIATGKSSVARRFVERGIPVIDADQVAREVVEPGQPALLAIVDAFGPGVLDADGALDRAAMRQRIIDDPDARQTLEGITHPAILGAIGSRLSDLAAQGAPIAVVDAALMVETGSYRMYPDVVVVTCRPETQLARLVSRDGMTEERARALIATQLPLAEKARVATHLIENDGTLEALEARVDAVIDALSAQISSSE
ncbi:MAG: dephospho-CoA kinase [Alphaproteobacteria bacterium]|nr:dephospho-CoA kinase [Alphaproteobacteria bacterium]